ncbi:MAG: hypothetical protein LIP08_03180 [Bacteroides sp.]|nr:hypothetical protein [Bacteroides sp.]
MPMALRIDLFVVVPDIGCLHHAYHGRVVGNYMRGKSGRQTGVVGNVDVHGNIVHRLFEAFYIVSPGCCVVWYLCIGWCKHRHAFSFRFKVRIVVFCFTSF